MNAIIKKELKSYFLSPIGYVVMGIFLLCFSIFYYLTTFSSLNVDLGGVYYYTALYGLIIIVPILTMRMFAEERKTGTEQLLLTSPVGIFKIVMGKFIAALLVVIIALILSLMYFAITSYFGEPNIMSVLAAMLGFIFISMATISIGMFMSSITENQIIAGVLTIAVLVISVFVSQISSVLSGLCLIDYYLQFAQGVIPLENAISLLLFTFIFISLTLIIMQRRKLVK